MKKTLATFTFEYDTVFGDFWELLSTFQAQVVEYSPVNGEEWNLTIQFKNAENLALFAKELGRDPV